MTIMSYKYIRNCKRCGKEYESNSPHSWLCDKCKSKIKIKYLYKYHNVKRHEVQRRDRCVCTLCGKDLSNGFKVAFLDGDRNNINLDNLATVCSQCLPHIHDNDNLDIISAKIKENNEELKKHQESENNRKKPDLTNLHKLLNKLER